MRGERAGLSLQKFFLLSALALGLAGGITAVVLILFTSYMHHAAGGIADSVESIYLAEELENRLFALDREGMIYPLTGRKESQDRLRRAREDLRLLTSHIKEHIENDEEQKLVAAMEGRIGSYLTFVEGLRTQGLAPLVAFQQSIDPLEETLRSIEKVVQINLDQARGLEEEVTLRDKTAHLLGICAVALLLFLIVGVLLWVRSYFYLPLLSIRTVISRFGGGDIEARAHRSGPSELREIAGVFNQMAENLKRSRDSQLRSVASVAHELKNPLGALKMSLHLLSPGYLTSLEEREETLGVIRRQIDQMERQVGDLLDAARIEAGQFELKLSDEDLRGCATASVALFQAVSPVHELELIVNEEPVRCRCDPLRIGQILNNFISNAIKYSPEGGKIRVEVGRDGEDAVVSVSDRGMGIPPADRERIFEPFHRSAASRDAVRGVGLGLSVSRHIAESHGGRIEVESVPGKGSTFRLRLKAKVVVRSLGA